MKDGCFFNCMGRERKWDSHQQMVINPAKKKCISLVSRDHSPNNESSMQIQSNKKEKYFLPQKTQKQHKKALSLTRSKDNNISSFVSQKDHSKQFIQLSNPEVILNQTSNNPFNFTTISKKTVVFLQQNAPMGHSILYKNQNKNKESSLFRGAKTIIKKLQTSEDFSSLDTDFTINQLPLKIAEKNQIQSQKSLRQYQNHRKSIRLGKLLGKGKYTHVYTLRDNLTGFIMSFKEIFKPKNLSSDRMKSILNRCEKVSSLTHNNIVNLHFYSQDTENIIITQEYFPNQLENSAGLSIHSIRNFLKQMIDVISCLHSKGLTHGQININHIGIILDTYKLRMSYARLIEESEQINYIKDIHDLAIVSYKLANIPIMPPKDSKFQGKHPQRQQILSQLLNSTSFQSSDHKNFFNLLLQLLTSTQNLPLDPHKYLHHPFFCQY